MFKTTITSGKCFLAIPMLIHVINFQLHETQPLPEHYYQAIYLEHFPLIFFGLLVCCFLAARPTFIYLLNLHTAPSGVSGHSWQLGSVSLKANMDHCLVFTPLTLSNHECHLCPVLKQITYIFPKIGIQGMDLSGDIHSQITVPF